VKFYEGVKKREKGDMPPPGAVVGFDILSPRLSLGATKIEPLCG